jgi:hypothetical protein
VSSLTLGYEETKQLLQRAVEEKGADFIYTTGDEGGCVYFETESHKPSCIVGHVLAYKGVTIDDIGELNFETEVEGLVDQDVLDVDFKTLALLRHAQTRQDQNTAWGTSVSEAIIAAERYDY